MIDISKLPQKVKRVEVLTNGLVAGFIEQPSHYAFSYSPQAEPVSITMPVRADSYSNGSLLPIFEMNLPEGYVRHFMAERLRRYTDINDLLFLALQGSGGIGRLGYQALQSNEDIKPIDLNDLLHPPANTLIFPELLEQFWLNTTVSGMQPKVAVQQKSTGDFSEKATLVKPNLIIKASGEDWPDLALNEFVCMSAAQAVGLETPKFYISDQHELFIMERFDLAENGALGMEDFSVLMKRSAQQKYLGSYEVAAKVFDAFCPGDAVQKETFFRYVAFSCMVGNGDAHLKNFSLLYDSPFDTRSYHLSPLYDVVCTLMYDKVPRKIALKIDRSQDFPNKQRLINFGRSLGVHKPQVLLEQMADQLTDFINTSNEARLWPQLTQTISTQLGFTMSLPSRSVGLKTHLGRTRNRKYPK